MAERARNEERLRMVRDQLVRRGIKDRRVLDAMERAPREWFVNEEISASAYADRALPIDCEQSISQPYIVALMTEALELSGKEKVLEVGTGSGYQTAILCSLSAFVVTVERHAQLSQNSANAVARVECNNVKFVVGDGSLGYSPESPYDRIIVTAAADRCPPSLFDQLSEGGIIVIPLGDVESQTLVAIKKVEGLPLSRSLSPCRFVPLIGEEGRDR